MAEHMQVAGRPAGPLAWSAVVACRPPTAVSIYNPVLYVPYGAALARDSPHRPYQTLPHQGYTKGGESINQNAFS